MSAFENLLTFERALVRLAGFMARNQDIRMSTGRSDGYVHRAKFTRFAARFITEMGDVTLLFRLTSSFLPKALFDAFCIVLGRVSRRMADQIAGVATRKLKGTQDRTRVIVCRTRNFYLMTTTEAPVKET